MLVCHSCPQLCDMPSDIPSSNTPDARCTAPGHRLASAFPDKTQPTIRLAYIESRVTLRVL